MLRHTHCTGGMAVDGSVLSSASYGVHPDPNVRNDDRRLQYDITYRVSGKQVWILSYRAHGYT